MVIKEVFKTPPPLLLLLIDEDDGDDGDGDAEHEEDEDRREDSSDISTSMSPFDWYVLKSVYDMIDLFHYFSFLESFN